MQKMQPPKVKLSLFMTLFFLLILVLAACISDLFQHPRTPPASERQKLFAAQHLSKLKAIIVKNNLGSFQLEKDTGDSNTPWGLVSPRRMPADTKRITHMLSTLEDMSVKTIFPKDKINIQNFSLDDPLLKMTFIDTAGPEFSLYLGLINPIDNSTYAMLSSQEAIYHVNIPKFSLGNLDYTYFIDSRIFTFDPGNLTQLKIFKGTRSSRNLSLQFQKKESAWIGKNGHALDPKKVLDMARDIAAIRSLFIIDKKDAKVEKKLAKFMKRPLYSIEIKDQDNQTYEYTISRPISGLPGLKLEKWKNFAITASNRRFPYILNRELLKKFSRSEKSFRALPPKRTFY